MYVVIVKKISDIENKVGVERYLPDDYPVLCKEFTTMEEALEEGYSPDRIVLAEIYNQESQSFQAVFEAAMNEQEKPWWDVFRFW